MSTAIQSVLNAPAIKHHDTAAGKKKAVARRTTVTLSPESAAIVSQFQSATGLSLSETISELILRSEQTPPRIKYVDGLPMADVPMDGDWISTEDVLRAESDLG